jgi:hypothetical protein
VSNGPGAIPNDSNYFNCNRLTTIDSMSSSIREVVRRSQYKKSVSDPKKKTFKNPNPEPISPENNFAYNNHKSSPPKVADPQNINIVCETQRSIQEILAKKVSEKKIQSSYTPVRSTRDAKVVIQPIEKTLTGKNIENEVLRLNSGLKDLKNLERDQTELKALLKKRDVDFRRLPQQPEQTNSAALDGSHAVYIRDMNHKVPILKRNESDVIINNFSLRGGSLPSENLM